MRNNRKHICVIGLGQFGSALAVNLARTCEVLAIDINEAKVNAVSEAVQQALILDARDYASLSSVVTDDFDEAFVSPGNLEASILCVLHLKKIGVPMIRAKAYNDDHASVLRAIGANQAIFPERETAERVAAQIVNPNLLDFVPLGEDYRVMEIVPPQSFVGKTLSELQIRNRYGAFVIAVKEMIPPRFTFLPGPDFRVKPSDILLMIGREGHLNQIQDNRLESQ